MSMKRQKAEYRMGSGVSSLLMIFIVLCLTTLSILSLSTARLDHSMTERNITIVTAYYEAANKAQRIIAQIDQRLAQAPASELDQAEIESTKIGWDEDSGSLYFAVDASYDRVIEVALEVLPPEDARRYRISKHALVFIDNWEPEFDFELHFSQEEAAAQSVNDIEDLDAAGGDGLEMLD